MATTCKGLTAWKLAETEFSNCSATILSIELLQVAGAYIFTAAKSLQSCLTLCDPTDGSPPGSAIPGILQARTLEWVAISFSNAWKWKVKVKSLSCVWLPATPWTAAYQAPLSIGFARQEYWSGVPLPSPPIKLPLSYSCNDYTVFWFGSLLQTIPSLRIFFPIFS